MQDHITVTAITLVCGSGPDHILIETTLPEGCYPFDGNTVLSLTVGKGTGSQYIEKNFPNTVFRKVYRY